jgi:hypothetical protein
MKELRHFCRINDRWALAADKLQWILQRRNGVANWRDVSFVSSTKAILARCMREKGVPADDAQRALDSLPDTFKQWLEASQSLLTGDESPALVPDQINAQEAAE